MISPAPTPVSPNIDSATPIEPTAIWNRIPSPSWAIDQENSVPCTRNRMTTAKTVTATTRTVEMPSTTR